MPGPIQRQPDVTRSAIGAGRSMPRSTAGRRADVRSDHGGAWFIKAGQRPFEQAGVEFGRRQALDE